MVSKILNAVLILGLLSICGCKEPKKYDHPTIAIQTYFGDIIVELYPEKAPKTVAGFRVFCVFRGPILPSHDLVSF